MIKLTHEQRQELAKETPRAVDPETQRIYVLVSEDVYERLQDLLAMERLSLGEQRSILHAAGLRAGWDDPEMDGYDQEDTLEKP